MELVLTRNSDSQINRGESDSASYTPSASGGGRFIASDMKALSKPAFFVGKLLAGDSLVVGVRGTATVDDCLTDLMLGSVERKLLLPAQTGEGVLEEVQFAFHEGMLRSAEYVVEEVWPTLLKHLDESYAESSNERHIAIAGHSLGGGVAQIVGLLIRDRLLSEYPELLKVNVKIDVYTYAGPPVVTGSLEKGEDERAVDRLT